MASDRSQSSQAPSRAQSSSVNGAEHGVNGEAHHLSDEASEPGLHEDVGSEDGDGDGDLFGDDGDEDAILKPYAFGSFVRKQSDGGIVVTEN